MEFSCRLGTSSGEIVEGIYIAQSEAHLRRELEEKGLHVLALRPKGSLGLGGITFGQRKPKIPRHEFLVFNQELATLLKAGMPLVQSLDILRSRLANPVFKAISVKDYRVDGNRITVTLRRGGQASFDLALVTAIEADEMPDADEPTVTVVLAPALLQSARAAHAPLDSRPFADLIETVSLRHGVDPELVHAVVQAESNYEPHARSHVGARGLMQVMPHTARDFGIRDLYDPQNNLEAGVQYLKFLLARFDVKRAIAAYNAGPANVRKYNGIPPFAETQNYVKKVYSDYLTSFRD